MHRLVIKPCVLTQPFDILDYIPPDVKQYVIECVDETIVFASPISLDVEQNVLDYLKTIFDINGFTFTKHKGYDLTTCGDNTAVTLFDGVKRSELDVWSLSQNLVLTLLLKNGKRKRCNYHGVSNKTEECISKHYVLESISGNLIIATEFKKGL